MYRKMARRYHPDVSKMHDAQRKFQEISAAYEVLKRYREAYCRDYERYTRCRKSDDGSTSHGRGSQAEPRSQSTDRSNQKYHKYSKNDAHSQSSQKAKGAGRAHYRNAKPIGGKDRQITYPLTLRYAIRLLKLGFFYIPGLKVKMKFTRAAFEGKTFRLQGKGYQGLFGGKSGDFLVRFNVKVDSCKFQLEEGDIYGVFYVPESLIKEGRNVQLDAPSGRLSLIIPPNYTANDFIKVDSLGLPADELNAAGHFYARLVAA